MNFTLDDATETEEHPSTESVVDVVLIGGGIMSATLGTFLHQLQPDWRIKVFERLNSVAEESSDAWNNAGTGHSALCEMNYT
ncbi:MAG: malate:quinone oxidoreductase, partial [Acetobacter sp.]|nr:malate:quinone oxidoreductase [Acetobacter sp.]